MFLEYTFQNIINVQEGYINVAFKTSLSDAVIFQLHGKNNAHITLMLEQSSLRLVFNFLSEETDMQSLTIQTRTALEKFNDNKRHTIRVHHRGNQLFAYVLDDNNNPIKQTRNISQPFTTLIFPEPSKLYLGKRGPLSVGSATTFQGCITGLKYQYLPVGARVGVNIDLLQLLKSRSSFLGSSIPAPSNGSCGFSLPIPPPLPTIVAPPQFRFRNPVVTVAPIGTPFSFAKVAVIVIIIVLTIIAVVLLFVTLHCIDKYRKVYQAKEEKLALEMHAAGMSETRAPAQRKYDDYKLVAETRQKEYKTDYQQQPQKALQPEAFAAQQSDNGATISYAPSNQPGYSASAASPKDQDDGDWFL